MRLSKTTRTVFLVSLLSLGLSACAPAGSADLALGLRFAVLAQAQTGQGLPADLLGLQVEVSDGAEILASTGCEALRVDDPDRMALSLDVTAGAERVIEVQGWTNATCGGEPGWRGVAYGINVVAGTHTSVDLFVTRLGTRLNSIHEPLPSARAFATATPLPAGRVLIAGGFDRLEQTGSSATLEAACSALIYDSGSGAIARVLPMQACRGLHQAIPLADGRVVLVGGASRATFDPRGATRPMLRPEVDSLLASAEVFDPVSGSFSVQTDPDLARALAAAATGPQGEPIVIGGRTPNQIRSTQVVAATPDAGGFSWGVVGGGLSAARSGARAVAVGSDVLVAGGNESGPDLEVLTDGGAQVEPVEISGDQIPSLARSGHSLSVNDDQVIRLALAGGALNATGGQPSADLLWGTWQAGQPLSLTVQAMATARAYHAAGWLGGDDGDPRLVLVGGLSDQLDSNPDLELAPLSGGGQLLGEAPTTGAMGVALSRLPDGSLLMVGGLDVSPAGVMSLSAAGQVLTP